MRRWRCPRTEMRLLPALLLVLAWDVVCGLKCYSCSYSKDTDTEDTCVKKPDLVSNPTATCSKALCYIKRIQFTDGGKVSSFSRGCIDSLKTGKVVNQDYTIYTRTCPSSKCNDWDGVADKYGKGDVDQDGVVIYAPGTGSDNAAATALVCPLLLASVLLLWIVRAASV